MADMQIEDGRYKANGPPTHVVVDHLGRKALAVVAWALGGGGGAAALYQLVVWWLAHHH